MSFLQGFHFPLAFPATFVKADPVPRRALPITQGSRDQLMALLGSRFPTFVLFPPFPGFSLDQDLLLSLFQWSPRPSGAAAGDRPSCWCEAGPDTGALGVLEAAPFSSLLSPSQHHLT